MTTVIDIMKAANTAYKTPGNQQLTSAWTQINVTLTQDQIASAASHDYQGVAWINKSTGEVIVGDRGTQSFTDFSKSDSHIAFNQPFDAVIDAQNFARAVIEALQRNYATIPITQVYDTGHSLGGTESQNQMGILATLTSSANPPIFVGINSPGASLGGVQPSGTYQGINLIAPGDVVHFAGGPNLPGIDTITISAGQASALATSAPLLLAFVGLLPIGVALSGKATAESHLLTGMIDSVGQTALGQIDIKAVAALSPEQGAALASMTAHQYQILSTEKQAELLKMSTADLQGFIGKLPNDPAVYDNYGYSQYGYNKNGYDIYGHNAGGLLDPAIAKASQAVTFKEAGGDGSIITVVVQPDGSSQSTIQSANNDTRYIYNTDKLGQTLSVTTKNSDGTTTVTALDPTSEKWTNTTTDSKGALITQEVGQQNTDGSSTSTLNTYLTGKLSETELLKKSADGSTVIDDKDLTRTGALRDETRTTVSTDKETTTVQSDANGDGVYEKTVTSVDAKLNGNTDKMTTVLINADKSTSTDVIDYRGTGSKADETVTVVQANGSKVITIDSNGDGKTDETDKYNAAGRRTEVIDLSYDSTGQLSKSDDSTFNANGSKAEDVRNLSTTGAIVNEQVIDTTSAGQVSDRVSGEGAEVTLSGATVTLTAGASATATGNGDTFNMATGATAKVTGTNEVFNNTAKADSIILPDANNVLVTDTNTGLSAKGLGNDISIAGNHDSVSGSGNTVAVSGNGDVITFTGPIYATTANTVAVSGNGDTITVTGSGNHDNTTGNSNTSHISGSGNSNTTNGTGNTTESTGSGNDTESLGSHDVTQSLGSGDTTKSSGNNDKTLSNGSGDTTTSLGSSDDTSSAGDGDTTLSSGNSDTTRSLGSSDHTISSGANDTTLSHKDNDTTQSSKDNDDTQSFGNKDNTISAGKDDTTWSKMDGDNTQSFGNRDYTVSAGKDDTTWSKMDGDNTQSLGNKDYTVSAGSGDIARSFGNNDITICSRDHSALFAVNDDETADPNADSSSAASASNSANQLVQAMGSFAPPAAAQTSLAAANDALMHVPLLAAAH